MAKNAADKLETQADVQYKKKNYAEAAALMESAWEAAPTTGNLHRLRNAAVAYEKANDDKKALQLFNKWVALAPANHPKQQDVQDRLSALLDKMAAKTVIPVTPASKAGVRLIDKDDQGFLDSLSKLGAGKYAITVTSKSGQSRTINADISYGYVLPEFSRERKTLLEFFAPFLNRRYAIGVVKTVGPQAGKKTTTQGGPAEEDEELDSSEDGEGTSPMLYGGLAAAAALLLFLRN